MAQITVAHESENIGNRKHGAISWRSIIAGFFVCLFSFLLLMSLGIALGGFTVGEGLKTTAMFTAIWTMFSVFAALFIASYFTARISEYYSRWVCMAEGLAIVSLFIAALALYGIKITGDVGRFASTTLGDMTGAAAIGTGIAIQGQTPIEQGEGIKSRLNDLVEDFLGDVEFYDEPTAIFAGIANRLMRGEIDSAKNYLARNSSLTPAEIEQAVDELNARVSGIMAETTEKTSQVIQAAGWVIFLTLFLGLCGSLGGGFLGSKRNQKAPVYKLEFAATPPDARVR